MAQMFGEPVRQHHADGDAFAVQQAVGVAGRRLERMAESVAEIEQRADAAFALVPGHQIAALARQLVSIARDPGLAVAGDNVGAMRLEPVVEAGIGDQAVFGHFRIAGAQLAWRAGCRARLYRPSTSLG